MKKGFKKLLVLLVILGVIFGSYFYFLRTGKNVDVNWSAKDYASYKEKVKANGETPGKFNLTTIAKGDFQSSGQKQVNLSFTSSEISSALSMENDLTGPVKNIKIKFLPNNEVEATAILTSKIEVYMKNSKVASKYASFAKGIPGTPVYIKAKLTGNTSNTISGNIESLSVGKINLSSTAKKIAQGEIVSFVNSILKNYKGLSIENLSFEQDKLNFKGKVPTVLKAN